MTEEHTTIIQRETLRGLRLPFMLWVILGTAIALYASFQELTPMDVVMVSGIAIIQAILIAVTFKKVMIRQWSMTAQILMLMLVMFIIHGLGSGVILLAISPILIIQAIIFEHLRWANISAIVAYGIFFLAFVIRDYNIGYILFYIEVASLMSLIIFLFAKNYRSSLNKQIDLRHANAEIQLAYNTVDQLTAARERERIARDLHDTLLQDMTGLSMQLDVLTKLLERGNVDSAKEIADKANRLAKETLVASRQVVTAMRDKEEQNVSFQNQLDILLKTFYSNYNLSVQRQIQTQAVLTEQRAALLIRVISEALMNIVKHSQSEFALIKINEDEKDLVIQIIDYGAGFDVKQGKKRMKHYGLQGMHERVSELSGTIDVESKIGEGTTITIRLPK
ncbi:sensor histidine kinase [Fructobacillus papyrifericola]|uniref:histidine kinase n=1 Tax=Fructobacillus papyrifericola TaxID=2713172 RepID=A0ABS5QS44_9LACO|nr:sensor histidine kinase [Fructobacillus papyrifericola]MBS9336023.1 sensor histidine kinase [Fructobacillus papyrifericola]